MLVLFPIELHLCWTHLTSSFVIFESFGCLYLGPPQFELQPVFRKQWVLDTVHGTS